MLTNRKSRRFKESLFAMGAAAAAAVLVAGTPAHAQVFTETFETDGAGTRYTPSSNFNDGSSDYFSRVELGDFSSLNTYSGFEGSFFWAAEDTDDAAGNTNDIQTLTFSGIDVSSDSTFTFSGLFGIGGNADYDTSDFLTVSGSIDGGASFDILSFQSIPDGDAFNSTEVAPDLNFDGNGDVGEPLLTNALASFSAAFNAPGNTLELTISVQGDSGDEEWAFDDLSIVTGGTVGPAPVGLLDAGDLVITEFMANPDASGLDGVAEYFEVLNNTGSTVDLDGLTLRDQDSDSAIISGTLEILPGETVVLGNGPQSFVDFVYPGRA